MVVPLVEACKYFTTLCNDTLLWVLLDQMSNEKKNKLKEDGCNIAKWFATLATFLGKQRVKSVFLLMLVALWC